MTLIVAIKCKDGIVVGADGAATLGALGQFTIRQSTKKLCIVDNCIVIGVSGSVGLGQRIVGTIEGLWCNSEIKLSEQPSYIAMTIIRQQIFNHIQVELQVASLAQQVQGIASIAINSVLTSTVVALPLRRELCLFQFDHQGAPEEAREDLPFVSIGSGQSIADPFLAFIRRVFWSNHLPTVAQGIFATLWTLEHAIQTNPGGVAEPKQVIILEKTNESCLARELPSEELLEHMEAISAAEKHLANFPMLSNREDSTAEPPQP
jgi:20S proteasome alpha/beta subunit